MAMLQTARQRLAQMQQTEGDEQLTREQLFANLLQRRNLPRPGTVGSMFRRAGVGVGRGIEQMMQRIRQQQDAPVERLPIQRANGGAVNLPKLPSLMELAQPNFQMQQAQVSEAPFTQQNPIVPMGQTIGPAFGGMPQDVYSWTPPQVAGGSVANVPRQPPAQITSTSAYTPVDSSVWGGINIPGAEQIAASGLASIRARRAEEQAAQERAAQEEAFQSQMQQMQQMQTDELMRKQQEFAAQLAQQQEMARTAEQQLTGFQSSFDERLQQGIMSELARRQTEQSAAEAERRERAMAAAAQAEAAERARQAQEVKRSRDASFIFMLSGGGFGGIFPEPNIYNPNEMVSVTRLVDGGRGGQYTEQITRSAYDLEQARARAYERAWNS